MEPADEELMQRVAAGETEAFRQLAGRHQETLRREARRRLGCDSAADDAVQETLLAAFRGRRGYDASRPFRAWLWTILQRECLRTANARRRGASTLDGEAAGVVDRSPGSAPVTPLVHEERRRRVAELLASLHPLHAQAVRARFFQQLSFDEIAARQHCSVATARQRVRWGLLRLAELLGGGSGSDLAPETRREDGSSSDDDAGRDVP